jgi:hypothetical protein
MHESVGLIHSMTHVVFGLYQCKQGKAGLLLKAT